MLWAGLAARAPEEATVSATYPVFFAVATALAGIAVLIDSAVLVVGAMIGGPEFGALAGICAGLVLRRAAGSPRGHYLRQAASSGGQLLLNLVGLALAGALTLLIQRRVWPRILARRAPAG